MGSQQSLEEQEREAARNAEMYLVDRCYAYCERGRCPKEPTGVTIFGPGGDGTSSCPYEHPKITLLGSGSIIIGDERSRAIPAWENAAKLAGFTFVDGGEWKLAGEAMKQPSGSSVGAVVKASEGKNDENYGVCAFRALMSIPKNVVGAIRFEHLRTEDADVQRAMDVWQADKRDADIRRALENQRNCMLHCSLCDRLMDFEPEDSEDEARLQCEAATVGLCECRTCDECGEKAREDEGEEDEQGRWLCEDCRDESLGEENGDKEDAGEDDGEVVDEEEEENEVGRGGSAAKRVKRER